MNTLKPTITRLKIIDDKTINATANEASEVFAVEDFVSNVTLELIISGSTPDLKITREHKHSADADDPANWSTIDELGAERVVIASVINSCFFLDLGGYNSHVRYRATGNGGNGADTKITINAIGKKVVPD